VKGLLNQESCSYFKSVEGHNSSKSYYYSLMLSSIAAPVPATIAGGGGGRPMFPTRLFILASTATSTEGNFHAITKAGLPNP